METESQDPKISEVIRRKKERKKKKQDKFVSQLEKQQMKRELSDSQGDDQQVDKKQKLSVFDTQKTIARRGRDYTVSVALAGSILDNAQSQELRTYLAGQVARALAVFNIDEVIVFDDEKPGEGQVEEGDYSTGCGQLARILQYLECPQYLRKHFFPIHRDLKFAGVLNPTDMPHHLRAFEESEYREGVVSETPQSKRGNSFAYIGLKKECELDKSLTSGIRVTVKVGEEGKKFFRGEVVSPSAPRSEDGLYWGYNVRTAKNLSEVFTQSPFQDGYDLTIGTSERGENIDSTSIDNKFKHLLIVFGGVKGLEVALEADPELDCEDPAPLFDLYLNTCPDQGSRTIRTEEAILVTLSALRPKILAPHKN